jgi:PmbA protein
VEQVTEATTRSLTLRLFVDGRYAAVASSDLRDEALRAFVADSVALTRTLAPDPFRGLPEPELHQGLPGDELDLFDPELEAFSAEERRRAARALEDAARGVRGAQAILSVTATAGDRSTELAMAASDGFRGAQRSTFSWRSADVTVKDESDRRPEESAAATARHLRDLPPLEQIGREGGERAIARLGARKGDSAVLTMAVENRVANKVVGQLLAAMSGAALQQKRSFLEGRAGTAVGSARVDLVDDPCLPRAVGSRRFDTEGIAARARPLFSGGFLRGAYLDTYYARKLGVAPTSGESSNVVWRLGTKSGADLLRDVTDGILVTAFLGGNSNQTTGDFSVGVQGFRVRGGALAEPLAEMNASGNHLELWSRLAAVGNDPHVSSALRTPTLVFEGVHIAGR